MSGFIIFYVICVGLSALMALGAFWVERVVRAAERGPIRPYTLQDLITLAIMVFIPIVNIFVALSAFGYMWKQSSKIVLFGRK